MKKYIYSAILFSLTIPAFANVGVREKGNLPETPVFHKHEIKGDIIVNGRTFHLLPPSEEKVKVSYETRAAEITPVIYDAPGITQLYCKDVIGYGLGTPIQAYAVASQMNWDNKDAYIYDIITAAPMGTYVKASMEDGELVLPMNQTVLDFDDEEYALNLGLLKPIFTVDTDGEIYVWFEYSDDYDSVSYTIEEGGTLILESPEPKYDLSEYNPADFNFPYYVIGYYYNDEYTWSGYCDVFQAYDEFNYSEVVMPENVELQSMTYFTVTMNDEPAGVIVWIAEDTDSLYIKGLSPYAPDAVFKADFIEDGTKLAVAPNQYIGLEEGIYYIITNTGYITTKGELEILEDDTPSLFNVIRDDKTGKIISISADKDSEYFLVFNDDPFYFYPFDFFPDIVLTRQDSFEGTPSTPYDVYYEDYSKLMGANFVFFNLSSLAANGDIIDINNLYYSIYLNGEPVEFEQQDALNLNDEEMTIYRGIKEPTYLIPYTFANDVDLYEDSGGTFVVGLYSEGIESVGVQAVYICGDETTRSEVVTVETKARVKSIELDSTAVKDVRYYDLKGQRINNPDKGFYIQVEELEDGRITHKKMFLDKCY